MRASTLPTNPTTNPFIHLSDSFSLSFLWILRSSLSHRTSYSSNLLLLSSNPLIRNLLDSLSLSPSLFWILSYVCVYPLILDPGVSYLIPCNCSSSSLIVFSRFSRYFFCSLLFISSLLCPLFTLLFTLLLLYSTFPPDRKSVV